MPHIINNENTLPLKYLLYPIATILKNITIQLMYIIAPVENVFVLIKPVSKNMYVTINAELKSMCRLFFNSYISLKNIFFGFSSFALDFLPFLIFLILFLFIVFILLNIVFVLCFNDSFLDGCSFFICCFISVFISSLISFLVSSFILFFFSVSSVKTTLYFTLSLSTICLVGVSTFLIVFSATSFFSIVTSCSVFFFCC